MSEEGYMPAEDGSGRWVSTTDPTKFKYPDPDLPYLSGVTKWMKQRRNPTVAEYEETLSALDYVIAWGRAEPWGKEISPSKRLSLAAWARDTKRALTAKPREIVQETEADQFNRFAASLDPTDRRDLIKQLVRRGQ